MFYEDDSLSVYNKSSTSMSELASESVDLVITDPPYGIDYLSGHRVIPSFITSRIAGDREFPAQLIADVLKECCRVLKPDTALYIFSHWRVLGQALEVVERYFIVRNVLVWVKNNWGGGNLEGAYAPGYELIIFAVKGNPLLDSEKRPNDVVECSRVFPLQFHPTEKPVPLLEKLILNSSKQGELVLDPFAGSCSTLRAAKNLGRRGVGYEIDARWLVKGVNRLRQETFKLG